MILPGFGRLNCGTNEEDDMTIQGKITGVRTVGVPVTDQDQALDFYVGTLGLEKRLDADMGGGRRWIEVAPAGAATSIALIRAHEGLSAGVETGIRLVSPDADAVHAGLRTSGVDTGEILRWEGVPPMFAFRDPDGNGMEIVEQP
jgi:lactoylglutathione lyase